MLLCAGFEAHQTIFLVNGEDQPFHFMVQESSCHSEGYQDSLVVEPMEGTVPPKDKYVIASETFNVFFWSKWFTHFDLVHTP